MIKKIGKKLESVIESYGSEDALLYKGSEIVVSLDSFRSLESIDVENDDSKLVYFVDGGQAQILNGGSFMLSFIRVAAVGYKGEVKVDIRKNEFYVLTYLVERQGRKYFESKIFPMEGSERLILEDSAALFVALDNDNLTVGKQNVQIGSVVNMIRRFSELKYVYKLSSEIGEKGIVVIDGSLQASYTGEDKIINEFGVNVCALAKSNNLFTRNGNNPCVYLNRLCSLRVWSYSLVPGVAFVKLDSRALHVFRFDGNIELLANLDGFCHDPLFLGYPYGLILVDKLARVSNVEKQSLRAQFLLLDEAKIFRDYLTTNNAHEILDTVF